jgi:hypothetical protein
MPQVGYCVAWTRITLYTDNEIQDPTVVAKIALLHKDGGAPADPIHYLTLLSYINQSIHDRLELRMRLENLDVHVGLDLIGQFGVRIDGLA